MSARRIRWNGRARLEGTVGADGEVASGVLSMDWREEQRSRGTAVCRVSGVRFRAD